MTLGYVAKVGLVTQKTNIDTKKIDSSPLVTYAIVLAGFSVQDKLGKVQFFEETFLLTNTNMEMVVEMRFLTLSNANVQFIKKKLK